MENYQKQMIKILSKAIRGDKIENIEWNDSEFALICEEAEKHVVSPLIFQALRHKDEVLSNQSETFRDLKKLCFTSSIQQIQHMQQVSRVLDYFNKAKIPVIVLKGLFLRELYPYPEFRTMSDADILIAPSDFEAAQELLLQMGYFDSGHEDSKHIRFAHKYYPPVELHHSIIDPNIYQKAIKEYESSLWHNAIPIEINKIKTLTLSYEDNVLYLSLHMAKHYYEQGVGMRQLCDLILLLEFNGNTIDWERIFDRAKQFNLTRFVSLAILTGHKFFEMQIPQNCKRYIDFNERKAEFFIYDVLDGGVYGYCSQQRKIGNRLIFIAQAKYGIVSVKSIGMLRRFLFPPIEYLEENYKYCTNNKVLIPIAWVHRIFSNILRKDRKDRINSLLALFKHNEKLDHVQQRAELIQWLKEQ